MNNVPLNFLKAFEVAARHGSFVKAAAELCVTPAAVSQQVRSLEERLGVELFIRSARGVRITGPGRDYAVKVRQALADLESATLALSRPLRSGRLNVSTFYSFASLWLLPRLGHFRAAFPEIDVRLKVTSTLVDLLNGEADVAIRYGPGDYAGCRSTWLMGDSVFPVCSPALIGTDTTPRVVADLLRYPLLVDDGLARSERRLLWEDWLEGGEPRNFIHLPDGFLTLQSALLGHGVALVRRSTVTRYLKAGRLIRLLDDERPTLLSYWVVTPETAINARSKAFENWMLEQLRDNPELPGLEDAALT